MYSDNILLLKEFTPSEFTPSELTTATTVQLIEREIQRIADCTSLMSKIKYRWRKHLDTDHIEAYKILNYEEPPAKCRNIF